MIVDKDIAVIDNIEQIQEDFNEVLRYSQNWSINVPLNTDAIFEKWFKAKKKFIQKWQGHLISEYSLPVKFAFDKEVKVEKIESFHDKCYRKYKTYNLCNFLAALNTEDFFNNLTSRKYHIHSYDGNMVYEVPEKYKVIKAFKMFVDDKDTLREIQDLASRIIQENEISGRLFISVHPLDFLSASENSHNWRSCHSLDGDYRAGNLNYLLDESTVCCYLSSGDKVMLPNFPSSIPWYSKKWRVWLFFSNDTQMLFAGRQYPFETMEGLNFVKNEFMPRLDLGVWGNFHKKKICCMQDGSETFYFNTSYIPVGSGLKSMDKLIQEGRNTLMFNDLTHSSCYDPLYAYKESYYTFGSPSDYTSQDTVFNIGEAAPCPVCGKNELKFSEMMACPECAKEYGIFEPDKFSLCECCGALIPCDDMIFLENSGYGICQDCYDNNCFVCDECGVVELSTLAVHQDGKRLCNYCANKGDYVYGERSNR